MLVLVSAHLGKVLMKLPELELNDGDLIGAALVTPGFTSDLSTWNVTLDEHGLLTQTISLAQPPKFEHGITALRQHVHDDTISHLKRIVEEEEMLRFAGFPDLCVTDQESVRLTIRLHGITNTIDAYGPHAVAELGETETDRKKAARFCRLWDAIVKLTPFVPYTDKR